MGYTPPRYRALVDFVAASGRNVVLKVIQQLLIDAVQPLPAPLSSLCNPARHTRSTLRHTRKSAAFASLSSAAFGILYAAVNVTRLNR